VACSGQAVHAYKEARKLHRASAQRSKHTHSKHFKGFFWINCTPKCRPALCCALPLAELLTNSAATGWPSSPGSTPAPDLEFMCTLLAEHLKRLNVSASSGSDVVHTPFLKYVLHYVPRSEGQVLIGCMYFCPLWSRSSSFCENVAFLQIENWLRVSICTRRAP